MSKLVECVPNFSEGRDRSVIDRIAAALASVEGASVLDVDPGAATNRTVITVVGDPEAVVEAAFRGIRTASELIDMSRHRGEHPRIGATDVCPFVPVQGMTMEECAALARRLGERVGRELGIPVYLYEAAASTPARRNLADIRAGEYEGLPGKLADPEWAPDFGPAAFHPKSGATVIGARKFLVAYNVNLNTRSKKLAQEIAWAIREQGRPQRGPDGKVRKDGRGQTLHTPGRLPTVKAVGWFIEEYGRAQVSVNLTDFETAGLHDVFDACREEAQQLGLRVTGSELVGLLPLEALRRAGRHYLRAQGAATGVSDARLVEVAVQSLGLSEIAPFVAEDRVIEWRLRRGRPGLGELSLARFADEVASDSPAPGGGSVAALVGALAAGLVAMVGNLTVGRKGLEERASEADALAGKAQSLKDRLLRAIDEDTDAFHGVMAAMRMPRGTPEADAARATARAAALRRAVAVPAAVIDAAGEAVDLAARMLEVGNPQAASDAATAAACARAAAEGALFNVLTNLKDDPDGDAAGEGPRAESAAARVASRAEDVIRGFRSVMGKAR
jgi:glutamate formiminotransferase/formiminotetrahydrofolate cyclodeaminase